MCGGSKQSDEQPLFQPLLAPQKDPIHKPLTLVKEILPRVEHLLCTINMRKGEPNARSHDKKHGP